MKFLFAILIATFFCQSAKAQKIDSASIARLSPEKREEVNLLLRQATNARTTGFILCLSGGSIVMLGIALSLADDINNDYYSDDFEFNTGDQVALVGTMVGLMSIPFFIKIHNKRDAARAIIYADKGASLSPGLIMTRTRNLGVGLVIGLGK